jgi:predicted secreted protein
MRRWGAVLRRVVLGVFFVVTHKIVAGQTGGAERYSGMTVCADCSGIKTTLVLERDAQGAPSIYAMSEAFVGRPAAGTRKTNGTWVIVHGDAADKNATVYQLHPAGSSAVTSFAKVNENELSMLDGSLVALPASVPQTLMRTSTAGGATVVTEQTGGDVSLKVGGMLEVRLDANHTTGYSWVAVPAANPVVVALGKAAYEEHPAGGNVGVGGTEVWRFKATKAGKETLQFEYRRPWEKNVPAAKTVAFQVTVQ